MHGWSFRNKLSGKLTQYYCYQKKKGKTTYNDLSDKNMIIAHLLCFHVNCLSSQIQVMPICPKSNDNGWYLLEKVFKEHDQFVSINGTYNHYIPIKGWVGVMLVFENIFINVYSLLKHL